MANIVFFLSRPFQNLNNKSQYGVFNIKSDKIQLKNCIRTLTDMYVKVYAAQ